MNRTLNIFKFATVGALFAWFFLTIFVDIFTVPTVFRTVNNIQIAGAVGIKVFTKMNQFELIFAIITLCGSFAYFKQFKKIKWTVFAIVLFIWSLVYNFIMTPKIANTTYQINATEVTDPMYAVLQSTHAFYHTLYRNMDISKLLVLLVFIIIVLIDLSKNSEIKN